MQSAKLTYANIQYPALLREIAHPPKHLYVQGTMPSQPTVAVIGSRRPTDYGRLITYRLASELAAAGIAIVSGLAIGIDAIAHQAALEAGGTTVAVLGSGLGQVYPSRNRDLARRIVTQGGALISELEDGVPPLKHHFPARNRIIAGLSLAAVVTEAARSSGSLITAAFALEQNRLVMAVPGNVTSLSSVGCNELLRAGATVVTSAGDVLDTLNLKGVAKPEPLPPASAEEATIIALIERGVTTSRELIEQSELGAARFGHIISLMELSGKVRNLGAGTWVRR